MTARLFLLSLWVAVPVAGGGIASEALHTAHVWPGCTVSALFGAFFACRWAFGMGKRDRTGDLVARRRIRDLTMALREAEDERDYLRAELRARDEADAR